MSLKIATLECTFSKILQVVDLSLQPDKKEARKGGVKCNEDTSTFWHGNILAHFSTGVKTLMTTYSSKIQIIGKGRGTVSSQGRVCVCVFPLPIFFNSKVISF